jgi:DNA-binding transcriptional MerR regulator
MNNFEDSTLTFKEMVSKFNVTPRTLRYYEYLELLSPSLVGRERHYNRTQIARFKLILRGRRFGMKLEDIRVWLQIYDNSGSEVQLREWLGIV